MTTTELKRIDGFEDDDFDSFNRCPQCEYGALPDAHRVERKHFDANWYTCSRCHYQTETKNSFEKARIFWNTRHEDPQIQRLREALEFYADPDNWIVDACPDCNTLEDFSNAIHSVLIIKESGFLKACNALAPTNAEGVEREKS